MHSKKSDIRLAGHIRAVCNGCDKRFVGCHSKCRRYADAIEEAAQKKAVISAAVTAEKELQDYANKRIDVRMRKEKWGK